MKKGLKIFGSILVILTTLAIIIIGLNWAFAGVPFVNGFQNVPVERANLFLNSSTDKKPYLSIDLITVGFSLPFNSVDVEPQYIQVQIDPSVKGTMLSSEDFLFFRACHFSPSLKKVTITVTTEEQKTYWLRVLQVKKQGGGPRDVIPEVRR